MRILKRLARLKSEFKENREEEKTINYHGQSILQYASEAGVISDIHADDLIFQFLIENPCFSPVDLAVKYYFNDGANSAEKLKELLFAKLDLKLGSDTSVLEFASGYGCVTRHLIRKLAPVNIVPCDIHSAACSFIESTMGLKTIRSSTNPQNLEIEDDFFDAVFALSFFSHMPDRTWAMWLKALFDKVKPGGYLIFTTQGLASRKYFGNPKIPEGGIWFTASSEQTDLDVADYGNTIVTSEYVERAVADMLSHKILHIFEAGWWEHQDLYVIKKDGVK